jgi:hypothetical protein
LITLITEKLLSKKLDEFAEQFSDIQGEQDLAFDGLWLTSESQKNERFLNRIGTCIIPTRRKYKFDARSTEYLIELIFSQDVEIRAKAKLNLSARKNLWRLKPNILATVIVFFESKIIKASLILFRQKLFSKTKETLTHLEINKGERIEL